MRYVPSTVVIDPHGQPVVTRGYVEFSEGYRIYDDTVIVDPHTGHLMSLPGEVECVDRKSSNRSR